MMILFSVFSFIIYFSLSSFPSNSHIHIHMVVEVGTIKMISLWHGGPWSQLWWVRRRSWVTRRGRGDMGVAAHTSFLYFNPWLLLSSLLPSFCSSHSFPFEVRFLPRFLFSPLSVLLILLLPFPFLLLLCAIPVYAILLTLLLLTYVMGVCFFSLICYCFTGIVLSALSSSLYWLYWRTAWSIFLKIKNNSVQFYSIYKHVELDDWVVVVQNLHML